MEQNKIELIKHEILMAKQQYKYQVIIIALVTVILISNLVWFVLLGWAVDTHRLNLHKATEYSAVWCRPNQTTDNCMITVQASLKRNKRVRRNDEERIGKSATG